MQRSANHVQLGQDAQTSQLVVLKWRKDSRHDLLEREFEILKRLTGTPGVVRLIDFARGT